MLHRAAGGDLPAEGSLFQCIACPAQTLLAFFKVWVALHCDSIGTGSMEAQLLTSASSASEKTEFRKSGWSLEALLAAIRQLLKSALFNQFKTGLGHANNF